MAGINVTREDLQYIGGLEIGEDQFYAVDKHVRAELFKAYRRELDLAVGFASTTLSTVYTSLALRVLTNPTGARSVSLGSASTTVGGSDDVLAAPLTLSAAERAQVVGLSGGGRNRRPSFIRFTDPIQAAPIVPVRREDAL